MSAEIVNLRRRRKAKARTDKEAQAAENRIRYGRTKADKARETTDADRRRRDLDGKKLDDE